MLILLPPSETKATGGTGAPLDFDSLLFPQLTSVRRSIASDLASLPASSALSVLGLSEKLRPFAEMNASVLTSPTMPALLRYTGVLFDALSPTTLPSEAWSRLAVGSALFGAVRGTDMIPHYRLSGGTKLPDSTGTRPTMRARWGSALSTALSSISELVIDLRSGTYQQLGRVPGATTVRVEKDGKVVSHFNKHYRGLVARELAMAGDLKSVKDVLAVLNAAGMTIDRRSETELCLVVS